MNRPQRVISSANSVVVRPTRGDFPHTRRRSVRIACCSCTCCCFTFLIAGVGGVAGIVVGIRKACTFSTSISNPLAAVGVGILRAIVLILAYGLAGILIGAAIGFGIDTIMSVW